MTKLIDTHVHLDRLDDPARAATAAHRVGVAGMLVPAIDPSDWPLLLETVARTSGCWAALGIHPLAINHDADNALLRLAQLVERPAVIAIGEVGLDRTAAADLAQQEQLLRRQIALACDGNLPLLLHVRQCTGRLLDILRTERAERVGGILHAFNGSLETARQAIDLGFALGIGGVVTYPQARRLPEVVRQVPADWLVLETDAPDMPPYPRRADTNSPANLPLIAQKVAELRQCSPAEIAQQTTANARRLLKLDEIGSKRLAEATDNATTQT